MKAAGHKDVATTMGYVRDAEQVSADFGDVFPSLPSGLLGAPDPGESLHESLQNPTEPRNSSNVKEKEWRSQRELNPRYRRERPAS